MSAGYFAVVIMAALVEVVKEASAADAPSITDRSRRVVPRLVAQACALGS